LTSKNKRKGRKKKKEGGESQENTAFFVKRNKNPDR